MSDYCGLSGPECHCSHNPSGNLSSFSECLANYGQIAQRCVVPTMYQSQDSRCDTRCKPRARHSPVCCHARMPTTSERRKARLPLMSTIAPAGRVSSLSRQTLRLVASFWRPTGSKQKAGLVASRTTHENHDCGPRTISHHHRDVIHGQNMALKVNTNEPGSSRPRASGQA